MALLYIGKILFSSRDFIQIFIFKKTTGSETALKTVNLYLNCRFDEGLWPKAHHIDIIYFCVFFTYVEEKVNYILSHTIHYVPRKSTQKHSYRGTNLDSKET